jgi:hypothetical protein
LLLQRIDIGFQTNFRLNTMFGAICKADHLKITHG